MDDHVSIRGRTLHNVMAIVNNGALTLPERRRLSARLRRVGELLEAGRDSEAVTLLDEIAGLRAPSLDDAPPPEFPPAAA